MPPSRTSTHSDSTPYRRLGGGALLAHGRRKHTAGLVFLPPLIGDTALAQVHRFRSLRRDSLALYTFAYPGHPGAAGRFSLGAAIGATRHHLGKAAALAARFRVPLFGLGCCAAAIPLLAAVQAGQPPPLRLVLLNPLVRFAPATLLQTFWSYSRAYAYNPLGRLRTLPAYLDHLFPGIAKNRHRFGALERRRVALPRLLIEILQDRLLCGVPLTRTPTLCCYGEADALLQRLLPRGIGSYETAIRRHCPQIVFEPLPAAHFFAAPPLRKRLRGLIRDMFQPRLSGSSRSVF